MPDMKVTVFIAASLDGFIARTDGGIDWLDAAADGPDEDYGFAAFMKTVDALVMGRHTYEVVRKFGTWPYGKKPVIVLSSKKVEIPKELAKTVSTMSGKVDAIISTLATREMKHLYVDGGVTIQKFLNSGAIQRVIITRIPVLIGTGIPLFGKLENGDVSLKHIATRTYGSGLVQSEYEIRAKRRPTRKTRASRAIKAKK
jgi:dihydrofolate reductase